MRVSQFYRLGRSQPFLDFVDVRLDTDLEVFVDPAAIRALRSTWGSECVSLLQHFFETVLTLIRAGRDAAAIALLAALNERNEFHLGFSAGRSQGRGLGDGSAKDVWNALTRSRAARSALLQDLEDTCLMIEGIGPDMISDAVCNIIRGPLIRYTQAMCSYYGIALTPQVDSGPIWNPTNSAWERQLVPLPIAQHGKLLLVPKIIVQHRLSYEADEYYRHYLLPEMQREELRVNSGLVQVLKDGRRRVTKKSLMERYGANKLAIVDQTVRHPAVLTQYRQVKRSQPPRPLTHGDFAELERTDQPEWDRLLRELQQIPTGIDSADDYEKQVEKLLTSLFYPSLCNPVKQHQIHQGRKRVDITYVNAARGGFFAWVAQHYPAPHIFVECKNYGREVGNPDIDQLSGRFSPSRGQVGILICRRIADKALLAQRCRDTANDHRGFIIALDDDDIAELVEERRRGAHDEDFTVLRRLFTQLVM
jgi:hypothetical protein